MAHTSGGRCSLFCWHLALLLTYAVAITVGDHTERRISHVSVLLPAPGAAGDKISFSLHVYDGCYTWHTWNHSILQLEPVPDPSPDEACASAVHIVPLEVGGNASTKVVAADGGATLTCDVFIAQLAWLQVLTTTRTMVVDELHVLSAQAFDHMDNVFTTLQGLRLRWEFRVEQAGLDAKTFVELLSVEDAETTLAPDDCNRKNATLQGLESETVVVKGLNPGRVLLGLSLVNAGLAAKTVEFNIVDNLQIVPPRARHSLLLLMVNPVSPVQLQLERKRKGRWARVDTQAEGFRWSTHSAAIARIEPASGLFWGQATGQVLVSVTDQAFAANAAQQPVELVVAAHMRFKFHLLPKRGRSHQQMPFAHQARPFTEQQTRLLVHSDYVIEVQVYDSTFRRIYIPQVIPVAFEPHSGAAVMYKQPGVERLDDARLASHGIPNNYTVGENLLSLPTLVPGFLHLSACLTQKDDALILHSQPITGRECVLHKQVQVFVDAPVHIIHEPADLFNKDGVIYLPLHRDNVRQRYTPVIRGGSGNYVLYAPANGFFEVADEATLQVKDQTGESVLIVIDTANPDNNITVSVVVSRPTSMEFAPGAREAPIGATVTLELLMRDNQGFAFTKFDQLPLVWTVMHSDLFAHQGPRPTMRSSVVALKPGSTHVEVTGSSDLAASTYVSAFKPLALDPSNEHLLILIGSTLELDVIDGPTKIHTYPSEIVTSAASGGAFATDVKSEPYKFLVTCGQEVGTQPLIVHLRHTSALHGAKPTMWELQRTVECAVPADLRLAPAPRRGIAKGEAADSWNVYMKEVGEEVFVRPIFADARGRPFVAYASLNLEWAVSEAEVAALADRAAPAAQLALRRPGDVTVRAHVRGFHSAALAGKGGAVQVRFDASCRLAVLTSLQIVPETALLWAHPHISQTLRVTGGSGQYTFSYPTLEAAQFTPQSAGTALRVRWLGSGDLPVDLPVKVHDLVYDYATATATIHVADMHRLVSNRSQLALQLGHTEGVQLAAVDQAGAQFPTAQCAHMDPRATLSRRILEVVDRGHCVFEVKSLHTGHATIYFTAMNAAGQPVHTSIEVVVYAEEVVVPGEMAIRSGTSIELYFMGGIPGSQKVGKRFVSANPRVAHVNEAGLVTAGAPGATSLTVSWRSNDKQIQKVVEVVTVQELTGARLNAMAGARTVRVGDVFAVSALGEADLPDHSGKKVLLSALFYQRPGLSACHWAVTHGPLEPVAGEQQRGGRRDAGGFQGLFRASAPGIAQIRATLSDGANEFTASLDVEVLPRSVEGTGGLLLPTTTAYTFPFEGASYALAAPEPEAEASLVLTANTLETDRPTAATVHVTYDGSARRQALAINVAPPRHLALQNVMDLECVCAPAQSVASRHTQTVVAVGDTATMALVLLDEAGAPFHTFSEDDVAILTNRASVAVPTMHRAEDPREAGGRRVFTIATHTTGTAVLEARWTSKPQQRGDWQSVPAFPVRGFTSQRDMRPHVDVVMATWVVRVVDKVVLRTAFPSAVLHFLGAGGQVQSQGTVFSDDTEGCTPSAAVVALSPTGPRQCGLTYTDPTLSYHVRLTVQPVAAAQFLQRSGVAITPAARTQYIAKLPVQLLDTQRQPMGIRFGGGPPDRLRGLFSAEPEDPYSPEEPYVQVDLPDAIGCVVRGGDALSPASGALGAEVVAHNGLLYCVVYSHQAVLNHTHANTQYEVILMWSGMPVDVTNLRVLDTDCVEGSCWSWWSLLLTLGALYAGYRVLQPVFLAAGVPAYPGAYPGRAAGGRAPASFANPPPMLIPRVDPRDSAPPGGVAPLGSSEGNFDPFGARTFGPHAHPAYVRQAAPSPAWGPFGR